MTEELNTQIEEIFKEEVARELMLEINPNLTQEKFDEVWKLCNGNPWDAGILYELLESK